MPGFTKGPSYRVPFGRNEFLRSTQDIKTESYTVDASKVTVEDIDGTDLKVLQTGMVMAKITGSSKIGPYDVNATDGREITANIVGINDTFLPWQLNERDVEVAVVYEAAVVAAWCFEDVTGVRTALGGTTQTAIEGNAALGLIFK